MHLIKFVLPVMFTLLLFYCDNQPTEAEKALSLDQELQQLAPLGWNINRIVASGLEIENVIIGGRLHDIGKIGIRDSVLLKPGALTDIEWGHIKQHPTIGAYILKSIPSLADIIPIVKSHHERMDGKGYPEGLKGSKIPLWARMTAVADTYDALTSDRPYRKGMAHNKALEIIKDVKGTQLCPDSVDLFFRWVELNARK